MPVGLIGSQSLSHLINQGNRSRFESHRSLVRSVEVSGQLSNHEIRSQVAQLHAVVLEQCADGTAPPVAAEPAPRRRQRRLSLAQVAKLTAAYRDEVPVNDLAALFRITVQRFSTTSTGPA